VAGILRNPLYIGVLKWGKYDHSGIHQARRIGAKARKKVAREPEQVIELPVPALVSPEVFRRVHEFIQVDKCRRSRGRIYMLTGLAKCGRCGGQVQTKTMAKRYMVCANRYPWYRDMSEERRSTIEPCDLPHIQAEGVGAFVWGTVCEWMTNPRAGEKALQRLSKSGNAEPLRQELQMVESQIAQMERAQERVVAFVARANIKPEIAQKQVQELNEKLDTLLGRKNELQSRLNSFGATAKSNEAFLRILEAAGQEVRGRLDLITDEQRTNLVRRLVSRVIMSGKDRADWQVLPLRLT
jgi:hypothetical protein